MVDLKAKPYCLPDEDVRWVEETIAGMTPEEKVGQLFFQLTASQDENYLRELMEKYHLEAGEGPVDINAYKEAQYDKLAELVRKSMDIEKIYEMMGGKPDV